jgi:hypothetical protein
MALRSYVVCDVTSAGRPAEVTSCTLQLSAETLLSAHLSIYFTSYAIIVLYHCDLLDSHQLLAEPVQSTK